MNGIAAMGHNRNRKDGSEKESPSNTPLNTLPSTLPSTLTNALPIRPVILAGGRGTRLWPLSNTRLPKPFLRIFSKHSLLQNTLLRVSHMLPPVIVTHMDYREKVLEHCAEIGREPYKLILEPEGRNTNPAVLAAATVLKDEDAPILVMPSDHSMHPGAFYDFTRRLPCLDPADICLIGIQPHGPSPAFGYLEIGNVPGPDTLYTIKNFKEKPDLQTAQHYLHKGNYLWNSGFIYARALALLSAADTWCLPDMQAVQASVSGAKVTKESIFLNKDAYINAASISIDYAILEQCQYLKAALYNDDWNDVGTWAAMYQEITSSITGKRR